jgi:hypothetical protein
MKYCFPVAGLLSVVLATPSFASLQIVSPTPNALNGYNDFAGNLSLISPGLIKVITGDVQVIDEDGKLEFYAHAAESGYNNNFSVKDPLGAVSVFSETGDFGWRDINDLINPLLPFATFNVTAGTSFFTDLLAKFTSNSAPEASIGTAGFGIFVNAAGDYNPYHLYFGFDDGGAGPDDNHDDLIISVKFTPDPGTDPPPPSMPEPFSGLVWCGLAAVAVLAPGFARRRN